MFSENKNMWLPQNVTNAHIDVVMVDLVSICYVANISSDRYNMPPKSHLLHQEPNK